MVAKFIGHWKQKWTFLDGFSLFRIVKERIAINLPKNDKRIKAFHLGLIDVADLRAFHIPRACDTNLSASVGSSDHLLASCLIRGPPMQNQSSSGIIRFNGGRCTNEDQNDMDAAATRSMPRSRQLHSISIRIATTFNVSRWMPIGD